MINNTKKYTTSTKSGIIVSSSRIVHPFVSDFPVSEIRDRELSKLRISIFRDDLSVIHRKEMIRALLLHSLAIRSLGEVKNRA